MAKEQSNEIELSGFLLPPGLNHLAMATASLMPGNSYTNGMSVTGLITRIMLNLQSGIITLHLQTTDKRPIARRVFIFPTGMMCEEKTAE